MLTAPTSVIIYRNPAEYQFWEGGYAFPLIAAAIVCFIVMAVFGTYCNNWINRTKIGVPVLIASGIVSFLFTFNYLMV